MTWRSLPVRKLLACWPALAWIAGFIVSAALRAPKAYFAAALWGLLLMASFVAWGALFLRALGDRRRLGWAFDGSVGMALTLAVFGALACVRLVSVPAILIWSAAGPLLEAALRVREAPATPVGPLPAPAAARPWLGRVLAPPRPLMFTLAIVLLWAMAALQYSFSVTDNWFNRWDDSEAYRSFVQDFLDTGTLYQPFSYRRIGSYGGPSLLQAMVMALGDRDRVHISDNGICMLLMLGLVTGYRVGPRRAVRSAIVVAGLLLLTLPYERHNLGGQVAGAVFFLALFRLFDDPSFETSAPRGSAILAGLLVAAICTQRQNYFAAATGFVAFLYVLRALYPGPGPRRRAWLREGVVAGAATVAFLLPWAVLSYVNARTAFYPVWKGNMHPGFGIFGSVPRAEELKWALTVLFSFKPVSTIALLFLAGAVLPFVRRTRALHAFLLASVFAFLLMMHFFRTFKDGDSILRYTFAFTLAFGVAATLRVLREGARPGKANGAPVGLALVAVALGMQVLGAKDKVLELYKQRIDAIIEVFEEKGPRPEPDSAAALYRRIQESVPPGQPILATLDHTYLLDGRRNKIYNYDHPGAIGPRGGPPAFLGAEAFAAYLKSLGIRYLAYVLGPPSPEYQRRHWDGDRLAGRQGTFYQRQARYELDFFDTVTALTASRRSVFHEGEVHVLDLETPQPPPPKPQTPPPPAK